MTQENEKIIIYMVETPECCFITDCIKTSGYDYQYHHSQIESLYFDGENPDKTFAKNWMRIKKFPRIVERRIVKTVNARYELKDPDFASEKLPKTIPYDEKENYAYDVVDSLYQYKSDTLPPQMEPVEIEIQTVLKMEKYAEPSLKFDAIHKFDYRDSIYQITSADVEHQLFDKLIFPEICLAHRPCSLSSKQVYDITRQYVLSHIDSEVAEITSNYDFCFTVKKRIPKIEPETVIYQNFFARKKKDRMKIRTSVKSFNQYEIFQMTHAQENYRGYTAIPAMYANSEAELKEKMNEWLTSLMNIINAPICECPHCNGTGLLGEIERVNHNILQDISDRK